MDNIFVLKTTHFALTETNIVKMIFLFSISNVSGSRHSMLNTLTPNDS